METKALEAVLFNLRHCLIATLKLGHKYCQIYVNITGVRSKSSSCYIRILRMNMPLRLLFYYVKCYYTSRFEFFISENIDQLKRKLIVPHDPKLPEVLFI
jgi:hypothetical protein